MSLHLSKCHIVGNHMSWLRLISACSSTETSSNVTILHTLSVVVMFSRACREQIRKELFSLVCAFDVHSAKSGFLATKVHIEV